MASSARSIGSQPPVLAGFALVVSGLALGCFIEVPEAESNDPCDRVACSRNGYCELGECVCQTGFVGDPYAPNGCQKPPTTSTCGAPCGLNATCVEGRCVCVEGTVAACGTGDCIAESQLCDGTEDCSNGADEDPDACETSVAQQWSLVDGCEDGFDVHWRLWSAERDWVWPGPEQAFVTPGAGQQALELIACRLGETICFGAAAGPQIWGVGPSGVETCEACCDVCDGDPVDLGTLTCGDS